MVTLYNKVSFVNLVNVLTTMNKQLTMHLLHYLLIFVNVSYWKYSCSLLFKLVHSALTNVNKHNF